MAKKPKDDAADLFCGLGGMTEGLVRACRELGIEMSVVAVNHWDVAIETHKLNHPYAKHILSDVGSVVPIKAVPSGKLRILIAAPECTHHSRARGGKPRSEQSRASPFLILEWLHDLDVQIILMENVPDIMTWGPLINKRVQVKEKFPEVSFDEWKKEHPKHRRKDWLKHAPKKTVLRNRIQAVPDPKRKGELYAEFLNMLRALGYKVETKILCCADYGDATTRERWFLIGKKRGKITWPTPTHSKHAYAQPSLFGPSLKKWKPARAIIDWEIQGKSVFDRKKSLSSNTMNRIRAGLWKFDGIEFIYATGGRAGQSAPRSVDDLLRTLLPNGRMHVAQPYLVSLRGTQPEQLDSTAYSIEDPLRTLTNGNHNQLVEPFLVGTGHKGAGGKYIYPIDRPAPTLTTQNEHQLVDPFIASFVHASNKSGVYAVDRPLPTQTTQDEHLLVEPEAFILNNRGGNDGYFRGESVDEPLQAVTTQPAMQLVEPDAYLLGQQSGATLRPVAEPVPTIAAEGAIQLVEAEPFIVGAGGNQGSGRPQSVDKPLGTILADDHRLLVDPIISSYHGGDDGEHRNHSVDEPLPTQDTSNRHALVDPYLISYYGNSTDAQSVDDPLDTVTTKERHALVEPVIVDFKTPEGKPRKAFLVRLRNGQLALLDIRTRMLKVHELAAAHSNDPEMKFAGNHEENVAMIGNQVPVLTAKALCLAALSE